MQEDAWDTDWDLHENLFRGWTEITENLGHRWVYFYSVSKAAALYDSFCFASA